jgi:hypothetical protein
MSPGTRDRQTPLKADDPAGMGRSLRVTVAVLTLVLGFWTVSSIALSHLPHLSRDYSVPVRAQVVASRLEPGQGRFFAGMKRVFVYRYIYEGQLFRASSYRPGGGLDEAIRAHPAGTMLTAYLDPEEPRFSMVWPGLARDQITHLAFGLALIVIGSSSLCWRAPGRRTAFDCHDPAARRSAVEGKDPGLRGHRR